MFDTMAGECCADAAAVTQAQLSSVEFWGIIIAAVTGVVGVLVAIYVAIQSHRSDARMTETLDGMAEDIDHLTMLSAEAAARAPDPTFAFLWTATREKARHFA
jgi:hypothetical protein